MDIVDCSTEAKAKEGVRMPLHKPGTNEVLTHQAKGDKEPREMYLQLLGPEAETTRRVLAKIRNRSSRQKEGHIPSNDEIESERVFDSKQLAEITPGGLVFMAGKWLDVTRENAYEVYYTVKPFRNQALMYALDDANFTKG